jgi:putative ABC transport system permease protein
MISAITLISLSNAMNVIVLERVKEIGTMRSFGFTKNIIRVLFLLETLIITFIGSIIGLCISYILSYVIGDMFQFTMPPPPGMTKGYLLAIQIDTFLILYTFFVMLVISLIASLWACNVAVNKKIIDALCHN